MSTIPTDDDSRRMFPYAWAIYELRQMVIGGRNGSLLDSADTTWKDCGDDAALRAVLARIRDCAQRVLDTLDEPVTPEGKAWIASTSTPTEEPSE